MRDCQPRNRAPRSPARPNLCGCTEIYAAERSHPLPPQPPNSSGRGFSQPNFSEHIITFFSPTLDSKRLIKRSVENFEVMGSEGGGRGRRRRESLHNFPLASRARYTSRVFHTGRVESFPRRWAPWPAVRPGGAWGSRGSAALLRRGQRPPRSAPLRAARHPAPQPPRSAAGSFSRRKSGKGERYKGKENRKMYHL